MFSAFFLNLKLVDQDSAVLDGVKDLNLHLNEFYLRHSGSNNNDARV